MILAKEPLDRAVDPALAAGTITSWVGTTRVWASPLGVCQIWLPDWHNVEGAPEIIMGQGASVESQGDHKGSLLQTEGKECVSILQPGEDEAERHLRQALDELGEYFAGQRREFTIALDPHGSEFYQRTWAAVAQVPYGETRSYGEIAREVGAPSATRAVGAANGANPLAPIIPCHRIIASDGKLRDYGPGLPLKHLLLVMEGALPETTSAYRTWAAQLGEGALLGVRATQSICRPGCIRPQRHADRPHRVFRTMAAARDAGFAPCVMCKPENASLFESAP